MKKICFLTLYFSLLCVFAFAGTNEDKLNNLLNSKAAQMDELASIGNEIHQKAQECHEALSAGDFKTARKAAIDAINRNEDFKATARKYGFKIKNALVNGNAPLSNNEIGNPLMYNNDLAEVVVLSEVILGKMSLVDAIDRNQRMTKEYGVLGFLSGTIKHIMIDYVDLNEAFSSHKKCAALVDEAFKAGLTVKSSAEYCQAD